MFLVADYLRRAASKEALMEDFENASSSQAPTDFVAHIHRSREILNQSRENLDQMGVEVQI